MSFPSQHIAAHQLLLGLASAKVWPFSGWSSQPLEQPLCWGLGHPQLRPKLEGTKARTIPTVRQNYDL